MLIVAHEGHSHLNWIQALGLFHLIFLHFPIALVYSGAIAEALFFKSHKSFYDHAARFILIASLISIVPTILTGLAFQYQVPYEGVEATLLFWHTYIGYSIFVLNLLVVIFKELHVRRKIKTPWVHLSLLLALFILVNITGYLGGMLTFGEKLT